MIFSKPLPTTAVAANISNRYVYITLCDNLCLSSLRQTLQPAPGAATPQPRQMVVTQRRRRSQPRATRTWFYQVAQHQTRRNKVVTTRATMATTKTALLLVRLLGSHWRYLRLSAGLDLLSSTTSVRSAHATTTSLQQSTQARSSGSNIFATSFSALSLNDESLSTMVMMTNSSSGRGLINRRNSNVFLLVATAQSRWKDTRILTTACCLTSGRGAVVFVRKNTSHLPACFEVF